MVNNNKSGKGYELFKKDKCSHILIFCLLTLFTFIVIVFNYYYPSQPRWHIIPNPPIWSEWQEEPEVQEGFLVYSKACKIPDLDPYDPSIKHLIKYSDPINCAEFEALTSTEENILILHEEVALSKGITKFSCCYKVLFRDETGHSDNSYKFSDKCKNVSRRTIIEEEFIKVECTFRNKSVFYSNYHSFIHDKPNVERRCNDTKGNYSVLIVGVDAVSRLNMHRQLKKTSKYLLQHMDAIEMYGFNKVGDNTFPNLVPLLLGYDQRELEKACWNFSTQRGPLDKCDFIWNEYKRKGYRTFYAEDTPYISSFNYQKEGFYKQPTDYYFRNFIQAYEDDLGRNKPANCHLCVGSISETEAVLDWTKKFVRHFEDKRYFVFSWINSLTHDYLNMGSSGDHLYEHFFKSLHEAGVLNNTIIILMGDHGMRWGNIRSTYIGRFEAMLPMLLIIPPPQFRSEYPQEVQTLQKNAYRLVTPFDLHATLDNILHLGERPYSLNATSINPELRDAFMARTRSLFQPIPVQRSCKDASIDEHWCTCHMALPSSPKTPEIKRLATFIVNTLNHILAPQSRACAKLHLQLIMEARIWHPPNSKLKGKEVNVYTVTVKTMPGKGIFEATARYNVPRQTFELLGTVSRLNLYRNQSACVHDAFLKLYCYCKNNFH